MLTGNRLLRSRKGDEMITDFFAVIAFAVIILLFFILFSLQHKSIDKNTQAQFENKDANYMLESFLRAPAIGVDSHKTVADIIAEDEVKDDFTDTENLFKAYFRRTNSISDLTLSIDENRPIKLSRSGGLGFFDKVELLVAVGVWVPGKTYDVDTYIPGSGTYGNHKIHVGLKKQDTISSET